MQCVGFQSFQYTCCTAFFQPVCIYALVRKGLLPSYKKGKKLYFYEDELLEWIENGRKSTSEQNYDQMLATMQSGVRRKPKSGFGL